MGIFTKLIPIEEHPWSKWPRPFGLLMYKVYWKPWPNLALFGCGKLIDLHFLTIYVSEKKSKAFLHIYAGRTYLTRFGPIGKTWQFVKPAPIWDDHASLSKRQ